MKKVLVLMLTVLCMCSTTAVAKDKKVSKALLIKILMGSVEPVSITCYSFGHRIRTLDSTLAYIDVRLLNEYRKGLQDDDQFKQVHDFIHNLCKAEHYVGRHHAPLYLPAIQIVAKKRLKAGNINAEGLIEEVNESLE